MQTKCKSFFRVFLSFFIPYDVFFLRYDDDGDDFLLVRRLFISHVPLDTVVHFPTARNKHIKMGFYGLGLDFTGFYWFFQGFVGFLPGFPGLNRVSLGFAGLYSFFTRFYEVLYRISLSFVRFHWVS